MTGSGAGSTVDLDLRWEQCRVTEACRAPQPGLSWPVGTEEDAPVSPWERGRRVAVGPAGVAPCALDDSARPATLEAAFLLSKFSRC